MTALNLSTTNRRTQAMIRSWSGQAPIEVNVAIVGALGVGKSALTVKYITRRFIGEYDPDLEDTYSKNELIDQKEIILRLMDTRDKAGKDPDRYLKWADAFLVVYSITNRPSFDLAHNYLEGISQHQRLSSAFDTPTILVGNKVDMERYRSAKLKAVLWRLITTLLSLKQQLPKNLTVERIFHEMIREVLREQERCMPLRPLFISEDRSGLKGLRSTTRKEQLGNNAVLQEKNSRFKFFNKGKGFKAIFQST